MKEERKWIAKVLLLSTIFFTVLLTAQDFGVSDYIIKPMTAERLQFMPVTKDFRNYFVLQSIEDTTSIIIGDFVGAEKKLILIVDNDSDNTIDAVYEWYPDTKKSKRPKIPNSDLFTDLATLKKDIISGKAFTETYAYKMRSMKTLEEKMEQGSDRFKSDHGYTIKIFDPDKPNTITSEFFFGRKDGRYDLVFKTNYYKLYHTMVRPRIYYSVYCKDSKDPIVKEAVEKLVEYIE